jgi:hypothetical protein
MARLFGATSSSGIRAIEGLKLTIVKAGYQKINAVYDFLG